MNEFSADLHRLRLIHDELLDCQNKGVDCLKRLDDENLINFTMPEGSIFSNDITNVLRDLTMIIGECFCKEFAEKKKVGSVE